MKTSINALFIVIFTINNFQLFGQTCSDGIQNGTEIGVDCGGTCAPCAVGTNCAVPHVIVGNYSNTGMTTAGFGDEYDASDACATGYMTGDDYVFEYSPSGCEKITIEILSTMTYTGLFLIDGCPDDPLANCVNRDTHGAGIRTLAITDQEITPGKTYYIVISTYSAPQSTNFDIDITITPIACPTCDDGIMNGDEIDVDCGGSCPTCLGTSCSDPVVITSLPYSNTSINTTTRGDIYSETSVCGSNYLKGNDYVFEYTAVAADTCLTISMLNGSTSSAGLFLFDGCPDDLVGTNCIESATGSTNLQIRPVLTEGVTYYIVLSTNPSPQTMTFDFSMINSCPPPCDINPPANDICGSATHIDNLEGYCGNTSASYTSGDAPAGFCGTIENNSWLTFTASATTASINVFVSNCTLGDGIQIEMYETSDCITFSSVSNCWSPDAEIDGVITANGLTIGNDYYVMIDGFGSDVCDYVIGAATGISIPLSLTTFTADCYNNNMQLKWSLSAEKLDYFLIEKAYDLKNYTVVDRIQVDEKLNDYEWKDNASDNNAYYRIREVDFNGNSKYSNIIKSNCEKSINETDLKIYPNPFKNQLTIELSDNTIEEIEVEINNQFSKMLYKEKLKMTHGKSTFKLNESLPKGSYFIKVLTENETIVEKIIKN